MARVELHPLSSVFMVVLVLMIAAWLWFLRRNEVFSLHSQDKQPSGFDAMTLSPGIPFSPESTLRRALNADSLPRSDQISTVEALIRAAQWRLGLFRLMCVVFCWIVWFDVMIGSGGTTLQFFTTWNFTGLTFYFTAVCTLTFSEFFAYYATIHQSPGELGVFQDCLFSMESGVISTISPACVECCRPVSDGAQSSIGRCMRRSSYVFAVTELALSSLIFVVSWVLLYTFGDRELRKILVNFWSISMHVVNLCLLFGDYFLSALSVVYLAQSKREQHRNDFGRCQCAVMVHPLAVVCFQSIYVAFSWTNTALGTGWAYYFMDPSKPTNVGWFCVITLLILGCWLWVYCLDNCCLNKFDSDVRPLQRFFELKSGVPNTHEVVHSDSAMEEAGGQGSTNENIHHTTELSVGNDADDTTNIQDQTGNEEEQFHE